MKEKKRQQPLKLQKGYKTMEKAGRVYHINEGDMDKLLHHNWEELEELYRKGEGIEKVYVTKNEADDILNPYENWLNWDERYLIMNILDALHYQPNDKKREQLREALDAVVRLSYD